MRLEAASMNTIFHLSPYLQSRPAAWLRVLGTAELPFDIPVEIEAEVRLVSGH